MIYMKNGDSCRMDATTLCEAIERTINQSILPFKLVLLLLLLPTTYLNRSLRVDHSCDRIADDNNDDNDAGVSIHVFFGFLHRYYRQTTTYCCR